jgi:RNA polymerase subunit RPABC4/transcription elongation factor Spt4
MNTNIKYYERKVPIVDTYSVKELEEIVKNSYSFKEVILKLGYKTQNGSNIKTVRNRLENLNIDYSHFASTMQIKRTYENVFCKNSTATQHVLRRWYKKISNDNICTICGQDKIWNNKELTMILDHIGGDNHNNVTSNLRWICPNCNSQLPTFAGRNLRKGEKTDNSNIGYSPTKIRNVKLKHTREKKICPICNKNILSNSDNKMCIDCYKNYQSRNIPAKEELEKLIYNTPFVKIGKKYGVSDNAVRNWCKKYGLPYKYNDLHKR